MANYPRVTHPCAAKHTRYCYRMYSARLACLIHAASVRSEPESNSPSKMTSSSTLNQNQITDSNLVAYILTLEIHSDPSKLSLSCIRVFSRDSYFLSHKSIFKEQLQPVSRLKGQRRYSFFSHCQKDFSTKNPSAETLYFDNSIWIVKQRVERPLSVAQPKPRQDSRDRIGEQEKESIDFFSPIHSGNQRK